MESKEVKVIQVIKAGFDECDHTKLIYGNPIKVSFTFPPVVKQQRICTKCGRFELVESGRANKYDDKKLNDLYMKFEFDDGEGE